LAQTREVAQIAAALGRQFSHELITAVATMPSQQLNDALAQLVYAELVFRRGTPPDAEYTFKHALVQDAAYGTLLRSRRQQLHARIAAVLEERFPDIVSAQPALLAQHCAEAGLVERAIIYWLKAGRLAMTRSAMVEAIAQLTKGLELVSRLPVTRQTQQCELDLRMTLGTAFTAAKGYAASETGEAYARARQLCEELGDTPAFARVGYGQYLFHLIRAEVQRSHEVALEILSFAENTGSEEALILGNRVLGVTLYERGQCLSAREHLKIAWNLLERHQGQSGYATRGRDARIMIPTWEMYIASRQGFLDQALEARGRALAEAEGSS
jgi:predicted ATPase